MKSKINLFSIFAMLVLLTSVLNSYGEIPDWYKGTPYGGKPQIIPGRIEFEYHDDGGLDVGFNTDYIAEGPVKEYRPLPHISVDKTNSGINVDTLFDGTLYPGKETPHSLYVGWTHVADWARYTVFVEKTGDYIVSSTFAQGEETHIGFTLTINGDVSKKQKIVLDYGTGGGWHTWKKFDEITTVHLESGLNMIEFYMDIHHLNYDYLEFRPAKP